MKYFIEIVILISLFFLFFSSWASAQVTVIGDNVQSAPPVFVVDLNLEKKNYTIGDTLTGVFLVQNYGKDTISGISYRFSINEITNFGTAGKVLDEVVVGKNLQADPNQKFIIPISYKIPSTIASGDYIFRVALFTNIPLGWEDINVSIIGTKNFLVIKSENRSIISSGEELNPTAGFQFDPNQTIAIKMEVNNPSTVDIETIPRIKIYRFINNVDRTVKEMDEQNIVFVSGATKTLKYEMPAFSVPGTYLAEFVLVNSSSNSKISSTEFFRWNVKGISAEIHYINVNNFTTPLNVTIDYTGPGDTSNAGLGQLKASIYENDELLGTSSKEIILYGGNYENLLIPLKRKPASISIVAEIIKDGNTIANYTSKFDFEGKLFVDPSGKPITEKTNEAEKKLSPPLLLISVIVLAALVALSITYIFKKRKIPQVSIYLIFVGFVFILNLQFVFAADTTIIWNRPLPNSEYTTGDEIDFQGAAWITVCLNSMLDSNFDFYLTDINGNNRFDLGQLDEPGRLWMHVYGPVEYSTSFTMPASEQLKYGGNIKACVHYVGKHASWISTGTEEGTACVDIALKSVCGDSKVDIDEECDPPGQRKSCTIQGNDTFQTCTNTCQWSACTKDGDGGGNYSGKYNQFPNLKNMKISGDLNYFNVFWVSQHYDTRKDLNVECVLNCEPRDDPACVANCTSDFSKCTKEQQCIPFPFRQIAGKGSCTVPTPNYDFSEVNKLVCRIYDPENSNITNWY